MSAILIAVAQATAFHIACAPPLAVAPRAAPASMNAAFIALDAVEPAVRSELTLQPELTLN